MEVGKLEDHEKLAVEQEKYSSDKNTAAAEVEEDRLNQSSDDEAEGSDSDSVYEPVSESDSDSDSAYAQSVASDSETDAISDAESVVIPLYHRSAACQAELPAPDSPTTSSVQPGQENLVKTQENAAVEPENDETDSTTSNAKPGQENSVDKKPEENAAEENAAVEPENDKTDLTTFNAKPCQENSVDKKPEENAAVEPENDETDLTTFNAKPGQENSVDKKREENAAVEPENDKTDLTTFNAKPGQENSVDKKPEENAAEENAAVEPENDKTDLTTFNAKPCQENSVDKKTEENAAVEPENDKTDLTTFNAKPGQENSVDKKPEENAVVEPENDETDSPLNAKSCQENSVDEKPDKNAAVEPENDEKDSPTTPNAKSGQENSVDEKTGENVAVEPENDEIDSPTTPNEKLGHEYPVDKKTENAAEEPENDETDSPRTSNAKPDQENSYKKPYRLCIFCNTYKSKLSQHIAKQHKDIDRVQYALNLPKAEKDNEFAAFKKEGILAGNKVEARKNKPVFERERASKSGSVLMKCGNCSAFLSKKYIKRHENLCKSKAEGATNAPSIPASLIDSEFADTSDSYMKEVQSRYRTSDEAGELCVNDKTLTLIGGRLWTRYKGRQDKKGEVRKSVMTSVRRIAGLYVAFKSAEKVLGPLPKKEGAVIDLFNRSNFRHLEEAVEEYTKKEEGGIKAGLKQAIYYLLKTAAKIIKGTFYIEDRDDLAEQIDRFVAVLELNKETIFGDASYVLTKNREEKLRLPCSQPLDDDIMKVKCHTLKKMNQLTNDMAFYDEHVYAELRDNVITRLTLFNARRGGEPSRLFAKNWLDAEKNKWLDQQMIDNLDPIDQHLAKTLKVGYQGGKGLGLVPVLFPEDTHKAIRTLCDEDVRRDCQIAAGNAYLFPSIRSMDHVSGWHALHRVCDDISDLQSPQTLTATKNRHRVSMKFALLDIPQQDRGAIFKHLGHSEEINTNVYQAPLAIREVTVVGRRLQDFDKGRHN